MSSPESAKQLANIVFISIPEDLQRTVGSFTIDPSVLIPVEVVGEPAEWQVQDLTWEMIVSAMLKILVYDPNHDHGQYYRSFVLAVKPDIVADLLATGVTHAKEKDYEIAEELFKAAASLNPDETAIIVNLALVYEEHAEAYERGSRKELAEEYHGKSHRTYLLALEKEPGNAPAHYNLGHFYLRQNNFAKAREHFRDYLEGSSDDERKKDVEDVLREIDTRNEMNSLFSEAYDFIRLGKELDGVDKITRFLGEHPDVWNAWFLLGWAYRRLGRYLEGKKAFSKALDLGPSQPDTLNELAICLMELDEYNECRTALRRALQLEPENVKIISNMGILALREQKSDEARGYFRAVLEISPDDPIASNYLEFLDDQEQ